MKFLREMLSEGGSTPSTTRVLLLVVVLTCCLPVLAWTYVFLRAWTSPDLPGGVIGACTGLAAILATLKGFEKTQQAKDGDQPPKA